MKFHFGLPTFSLFLFASLFLSSLGWSQAPCTFVPDCSAFDAQTEWVSQGNFGNYPHLVAGDIDGDGVPEIIANRPNSSLVNAIDGATGNTEWSTALLSVPGDGTGIAIGDMDGDGLGEVVITDGALRLYVLEHDGTIKFNTAPNAFGYSGLNYARITITLADFDQNGTPEILIGNQILNGQTGALIASGGASLSKGRNPGRGNDFFMPVAADILPASACADCGGLEFVAGNTVFAVNLAAGTAVPQVTAASGGDGFTSIADWDMDGDIDGAIMSGSNVYVWDLQTPTVIGSFNYAPGRAGRINIADLDGDGAPEMSFAGNASFVAVDNNFSLMWSNVSQDFSSGITGSTVFDFCGDGTFEVLYRDEVFFRVYDGTTGNVLYSLNCGSATHIENPLVLDVDADGQTEIVISCTPTGSNTGTIAALESAGTPWLNSRQVWNQHAYFVTNVNNNLSIPTVQANPSSSSFNGFMNQTAGIGGGNTPLAAADVSFSVQSIQCDSVSTVTVQICNTGDNIFPAGGQLTLYADNPTSVATTVVDSIFTSQNIAPGNCITETFSLNQTTGIIYGVVNDDASLPSPFDLSTDFPSTNVPECDYTNNMTPIDLANCTTVVPTLSDWSLIILALLVLCVAAVVLFRRNESRLRSEQA